MPMPNPTGLAWHDATPALARAWLECAGTDGDTVATLLRIGLDEPLRCTVRRQRWTHLSEPRLDLVLLENATFQLALEAPDHVDSLGPLDQFARDQRLLLREEVLSGAVTGRVALHRFGVLLPEPLEQHAAGNPPGIIADLFADLLAGDVPVDTGLDAHSLATAGEVARIGAPTPARTLASVFGVPPTHPVGWCLCTHLLEGMPLLHLKETLLLEWDGLSTHPVYNPSTASSTA